MKVITHRVRETDVNCKQVGKRGKGSGWREEGRMVVGKWREAG